MSIRRIFVFAYLDSAEPVVAGILDYDEAARMSRFGYAHSYLMRSDAVPLSPELALTDRIIQTTSINEGLPGCVRDAMPDYWGRLVYASLHQIPVESVSNADLLIADVAERVGFLDFSEAPDWKQGRGRDIPLVKDVQYLVQAAEALAKNHPLPLEWDAIARLLAQGSSLGGARPKSVVQIGNDLWLAKFPDRQDTYDVSAVEYATWCMAQDAGIRIPEAQLLNLPDGRHVFLSRRFDRQGKRRIPIVSALTALDLDETENAKGGYPLLADILLQQGDVENRNELFRRMVFNVAVRNTDDHLRNHALLYDFSARNWRLSPAYDLNPSVKTPGVGETFDLAINIGRYGRAANRENLESRLSAFGLNSSQALEIIEQVIQVVSRWHEYFAKVGVDAVTTRTLTESFESASRVFCHKPDERLDRLVRAMLKPKDKNIETKHFTRKPAGPSSPS